MAVRNGRSRFWPEISRHLARLEKSESWLARRLNLPVQTIASWKQRNQVRRGCLPLLAEILHWEGLDEEAAAGLGVDLIDNKVRDRSRAHPTEESLRRVDLEYRVAEKTYQRYAGHSVRVLQTLGANCFYAFSAPTNTPYEFEKTPDGRAIAQALARAICQGALCLYVRPNEEGVSYYRDTWGFSELVYQSHAVEEMAAFRDQLKSWMVRGSLEGLPMFSPSEADRILHERLDQCYVTRSPMWMPGTILSMIGWTHERELKTRMAIGLPGARFGGLLLYPGYLTLEFRFMKFLRAVVLEACKELPAGPMNGADGKVQLELPGDEERLKQTERFYERFSRLLRSVYSIEPGEAALS